MRKPHSFIRKFRRKPLLRHRVHLSSQENSPLFRSKSNRASAPVECTASQHTQAPCPQSVGSPCLYIAISAHADRSGCGDNRAAGDDCALASRWLSCLLALEVSVTCREAES